MSKEIEYSPHFYYAKIRETSKYKYQHAGFFPVNQDKERIGRWIGNDNVYPEAEIYLFEFDPKNGFYQFSNLDRNKKSQHYSLQDLIKMGLDKPNLEDGEWRNQY